jgi:ADP-heptose:LPS heptosyltransferase
VALPAFHALRRLYPDARMTFLTSPTRRRAPGAREVLAHDATFDEVIVYYKDESGQPGFLLDLYRKIRVLDIDLAVELPNQLASFKHLMKYLVLLAAAGVRRFEGFQRVVPADYEIRQVDRLINVVAKLGPAEVEPFPWIRLTESDRIRARSLLAPCRGRRLVGMHCGAKRQANRWAPESFIEVGKRFITSRLC